jgi:hypothetical protein
LASTFDVQLATVHALFIQKLSENGAQQDGCLWARELIYKYSWLQKKRNEGDKT